MSRPTKCTKAVVQQAKGYANGGWEDEGHAVPSISGLALVLGVHRETLRLWSKDDALEFFGILECISATQEVVALSKGLKNEYNSNIVKLLLGKHGYHEKRDTDLTSSDDSMKSQVHIYLPDNGRGSVG